MVQHINAIIEFIIHHPFTGQVWFDYREGIGREGPKDCLKILKAYPQAGRYEVYGDFGKGSDISLVH